MMNLSQIPPNATCPSLLITLSAERALYATTFFSSRYSLGADRVLLIIASVEDRLRRERFAAATHPRKRLRSPLQRFAPTTPVRKERKICPF
jgi:hypothetical protein